MRAIMRRDSFEIIFEESDKYAGKILFIEGQPGLKNDFYILPKPEMSWLDKKKKKEEYVDPDEYREILDYVLDKIKGTEYSFIVYNR